MANRIEELIERGKAKGVLTYQEVISRELQVMDLTAFALSRDHHMKIRVFSMVKEGALLKAATGGDEGTLIAD